MVSPPAALRQPVGNNSTAARGPGRTAAQLQMLRRPAWWLQSQPPGPPQLLWKLLGHGDGWSRGRMDTSPGLRCCARREAITPTRTPQNPPGFLENLWVARPPCPTWPPVKNTLGKPCSQTQVHPCLIPKAALPCSPDADPPSAFP